MAAYSVLTIISFKYCEKKSEKRPFEVGCKKKYLYEIDPNLSSKKL